MTEMTSGCTSPIKVHAVAHDSVRSVGGGNEWSRVSQNYKGCTFGSRKLGKTER